MITVVCAWHGTYFPLEPAPVVREVSDPREGVSHGMCEACKLCFQREARELLAQANSGDGGQEPMPKGAPGGA